MNLLSANEIKILFSKYGARPSKHLGQNFLIDKNVLEKIIGSADVKKDDVILEVGPGIGTLTQELAKQAKKVIAIEKDKKMCEILKETLKNFKNAEIINGDILKFFNLQFSFFNKFFNKSISETAKYKVVANIPYYLTFRKNILFILELLRYTQDDKCCYSISYLATAMS